MIRRAKPEDLETIMNIYAGARAFMEANGNPGQWPNGYPQRDLVEEDLRMEQLYVCETNEGIEAVFVYFQGPDSCYAVIREGAWLNEEPYGVLHRIAVAQQGRGIASLCLAWCFRQCGNLRGDTHEKNKSMQRLFEKNGFVKCGIVCADNGTDRIAYQKSAKERECPDEYYKY